MVARAGELWTRAPRADAACGGECSGIRLVEHRCRRGAVPATFAVGLSDTTSVSLEGGDAIGAFLFGEVWLEHPWQYFVLWIARLGTYATAISLVGVIVSRWQTRRRA